MSFTRRKIDITFEIGEGDYGEAGSQTVTLTGLRASANITKAGGPGYDTANVRVWGLTPSLMNQLTTLGKPLEFFRKNTVSVSAGDAETGMALVFSGNVKSAYQDFAGAPDVSLNIDAFTGSIVAVRPVPPSSFPASADVAVIMSGMANAAGLAFENSGVDIQFNGPTYFPGTGGAQMQAVAEAADIFFTIDGNTVAIWPRDGKRGGLVPLISPATGLVGYPRWTQNGIGLTTLYQPGVVLGGEIQLETSITPATGRWIVKRLAYSLEAQIAGGQWFMNIEAYRYENTDG